MHKTVIDRARQEIQDFYATTKEVSIMPWNDLSPDAASVLRLRSPIAYTVISHTLALSQNVYKSLGINDTQGEQLYLARREATALAMLDAIAADL